MNVDFTRAMQPAGLGVVTTVFMFLESLMSKSLLIAACGLMIVGLTACHREGPAERAGSSLDHAGQKVQDTLDPPHGPVESAGRKVDRALGN